MIMAETRLHNFLCMNNLKVGTQAVLIVTDTNRQKQCNSAVVISELAVTDATFVH